MMSNLQLDALFKTGENLIILSKDLGVIKVAPKDIYGSSKQGGIL